MDRGAEAIADGAERAAVRRQARSVVVRSLLIAGALVGLTLILPRWN